MGGGTGRPEAGDGVTGLLLRQRRRVHVAFRTGFRLWQLATPETVIGPRRMARLLPAVAVDGLTAVWLSRTDRFGWWRLATDMVDAAAASAAGGDTVDAARPALMPGLSLCVEAGVRGGPAAVAVPAALASTVFVVRGARGHRLRPAQLGWPLAATVTGAGMRRYLQGRRRQLQVEMDRRTAARVSQAFRMGQFDAASEADSVIDEAQRALLLLEDDGGAGLRAALAAWKASLAQAVRDEAVYLNEALLRWQMLRNLDSDLRSAVEFAVESDRPIVISRHQAAQLWDRLDELGPRGRVRVAPGEPPAGHTPGRPVTLQIGGHRLRLEADPASPAQLDLAPVGIVYTAVMVALGSARDNGAVRPRVALSAAAGFAALGLWAHRSLATAGDRGRRRLASLCMASGLLYSVVGSRSVRHPFTTAGELSFPVDGMLQGIAVTLVILGPALGPRRRALSALASAGMVAAGWVSLPVRPRLRQLAGTVLWPGGTAATAIGLTRALDSQTEAMTAGFERFAASAERSARHRGRQWVESLCAQVVADALARLPLHGEGPVLEEARRRLGVLQARLETGRTAACG